MKQKTEYIVTFILLAVIATSCNRLGPAGFWTRFHKDLIKIEHSDQGPSGGHREIYWESETKNTFTVTELVGFAKKNGWQLVDSVSFSIDTLNSRSFSQLKNDDYSVDILKDRIWPDMKPHDNRLFIFKTTWLAVEPGNTRETYDNGFAVLNSSGTTLKIYHVWGEYYTAVDRFL